MRKLEINKELLFEEADNHESVIVDSTRGVTHVLNQTATILLKLCNSSSNIDDAIEEFVNLFNADVNKKEQIRKDAVEQISVYVENGIVSIVEE